jgi:hypothetical protein
LLVASRSPLAHLSLIWFTVWSSVVQGGIMAVQSLVTSEQMGHRRAEVAGLTVEDLQRREEHWVIADLGLFECQRFAGGQVRACEWLDSIA